MFDEQGPDLKPEPDGDDEVWLLTKEVSELTAHITELVESEEKAWQTVGKLRVELETTGRLRMENINLKLELAGEKRALESSERNSSYNFEERIRLESLLEEHGVKPGPDIRIGKLSVEYCPPDQEENP